MSDPAHVRRHRLVAPAGTAKEEGLAWGQGRWLQEELLYTRFAIRQAVAEEAEISSKALVRLSRKMCLGIKCVVDRDALFGAHGAIGIDHGIAAAIGQHQVDLPQGTMERVIRLGTKLS